MQRYLKPHYPKVEKGQATDRTDTSVESSESVPEEKPKKKTRTKKETEPEATGVVPDADVVDDTPAEETEPKKKVRRAVRKA
jgi:hypothetical protein